MQSRVRKAIGVGAGAVVLSLSVGTAAMAEVTPALPTASITYAGVGSDTTQSVMNSIMSAYNSANKTTYPGKVQNFNAIGSATISEKNKAACMNVARPNGSSAGISALLADQASGNGCLDYARSSRVKKTDGTENSLAFYKYAKDAVDWSGYTGSTAVPASLTTAQLTKIYNCTYTNWHQVSASLPSNPIKAYIPQAGSGTRSFFLTALGLTAPGGCVNQSFEENEGTQIVANAGTLKNDIIAPFSVAQWIAQNNKVITDVRGGLVLKQINGLKPTYTDKTGAVKLNTNFAGAFIRDVFNVVKKNSNGSIPAAMVKIFGPKGTNTGFVCSQPGTIQKYGFALEDGTTCGQKS
jgi:ABC-type phosphate transport system substrate-binding protein